MYRWFLTIPNNALVSTDVSELLRSDSAHGCLLAIHPKSWWLTKRPFSQRPSINTARIIFVYWAADWFPDRLTFSIPVWYYLSSPPTMTEQQSILLSQLWDQVRTLIVGTQRHLEELGWPWRQAYVFCTASLASENRHIATCLEV